MTTPPRRTGRAVWSLPKPVAAPRSVCLRSACLSPSPANPRPLPRPQSRSPAQSRTNPNSHTRSEGGAGWQLGEQAALRLRRTLRKRGRTRSLRPSEGPQPAMPGVKCGEAEPIPQRRGGQPPLHSAPLPAKAQARPACAPAQKQRRKTAGRSRCAPVRPAPCRVALRSVSLRRRPRLTW